MNLFLYAPQTTELSDRPRSEAEIIAQRIASHQRWSRRRTRLRLRAALLGRTSRRARPVAR